MPVLRNAEAMRFLDIKTGIAEHGKEARLAIEDIAGGSFTIFVFSLFPSGTCGVELTWFIIVRVVTFVRHANYQLASSCCTRNAHHQGQARRYQWTDRRSPNHGRRADILP